MQIRCHQLASIGSFLKSFVKKVFFIPLLAGLGVVKQDPGNI